MANRKELDPIWLVIGKDKYGDQSRIILTASVSASGLTVTVRSATGIVFGKANGGGYDRIHTALAKSLTQIFGIPLVDGGVGERHVFESALSHGVQVRRLSQALYDLPYNVGGQK